MLRSTLRSLLLAAIAALALASTAFALPPVVSSQAPSQLQPTSTHLTAVLDPMGATIDSLSFDYGTTTSYGSTAPTNAALPITGVSGNQTIRTAALIAGLTPGTVYHFRLVGTTAADGPIAGADATFTAPLTAQLKPTVVTGPATPDPTFLGATLTGTVNPQGQDTTFRFHYATSQADLDCAAGPPCAGRTLTLSQTIPAGTADVPVTATIPTGAAVPKLTPGITYFVRLVASNATGSTALTGNTVTFFTGVVVPPPIPQPPAVTTVPAADITGTTVTLKGTVNPAGQDTTYKFQFGTTVAYGAETAPLGAGAGVAAVPVNAALINLLPGTTYHYRVVGTNVTGTSVGGDLSFTTAGTAPVPPPPVTGPPTATSGAATAVTTKAGTMNGVVTTGGLDTTYAFQYGTTTGYGTATPAAVAPATTPTVNATFPLSGLKPGVTYHYRLVASNSNNSVVGADMTFRTIPILVMQRMRATPANFKTRSRRTGTTLSFGLSGPGKVVITITQPAMGGRICTGTGAARRCLPAPSTGSHVVQRLNINGHRGRNSVRVTGRPAGKPFANGEYFLTARATRKDPDYGIIKSKTLRLKLHVVG
jgi:hypothetical protein